MSQLNIFGKVVGGAQGLTKYVLDNVTKKINSTFFTNVKKYARDIEGMVLEGIKSQPEYNELKNGRLRHQFGLPDGRVDEILAALDSVEVTVKKAKAVGKEINADVIINMIKSNYSDILSSTAASYTTEKGSEIPWLEWLLLRGQDSVVIGYRYLPKTAPQSRTGRGIMISGESAVYRVPPVFAGTAEDNWITRGLDAALPKIENYMNSAIERAL